MRVELEVARVHDRADRRLDGEPDAVRDRVGHAQRHDAEAARHDLVPRLVGAQVHPIQEAMLGQPVPREGEGERRAVDGHVEVAQEVGEGADVVFVPVGQDDCAEALAVLAQIGEVRDHVVHTRHLVVGEQEPAVDGHDVLARLEEHHVEPDLAEPPQGDQAHRGLGGHVDRCGFRTECGAHGGPLRVSPGLRRALETGRAPGVSGHVL
jgi:hypothetical protein